MKIHYRVSPTKVLVIKRTMYIFPCQVKLFVIELTCPIYWVLKLELINLKWPFGISWFYNLKCTMCQHSSNSSFTWVKPQTFHAHTSENESNYTIVPVISLCLLFLFSKCLTTEKLSVLLKYKAIYKGNTLKST